MNNHYIPRLLLKQFAVSNKVNTYDCATDSFQAKKLKNTFVSKDIFDKDLEAAFAIKLEGPFGDLLNHKLLRGDTISIDRTENMLMRKFLMIQALRSPFSNCSWDEMVRRTQTQDHPSMQAMEFLKRHHPEWIHVFEHSFPSAESYIPVLRKAMEFDSIEDIVNADDRVYVPETLRYAACHAIVTVVAFWDTSQSGQEFLLPKLPGISQMDQVSIFYKRSVIENLRKQWEREITVFVFVNTILIYFEIVLTFLFYVIQFYLDKHQNSFCKTRKEETAYAVDQRGEKTWGCRKH